jgi:dipeptidyl-peptidase-4
MKMNQYDASTGNLVKTLFEETSDKYVEPQHPLTFFPNSNTDFIWQSQRTGYNHLFHYNLEKGLVAQITKGDWLVTDILGFNEKKKKSISLLPKKLLGKAFVQNQLDKFQNAENG